MTSSIKAASHIKWTEGMIEQKGAKEIATCQQKGVIKNHYPITIILFLNNSFRKFEDLRSEGILRHKKKYFLNADYHQSHIFSRLLKKKISIIIFRGGTMKDFPLSPRHHLLTMFTTHHQVLFCSAHFQNTPPWCEIERQLLKDKMVVASTDKNFLPQRQWWSRHILHSFQLVCNWYRFFPLALICLVRERLGIVFQISR